MRLFQKGTKRILLRALQRRFILPAEIVRIVSLMGRGGQSSFEETIRFVLGALRTLGITVLVPEAALPLIRGEHNEFGNYETSLGFYLCLIERFRGVSGQEIEELAYQWREKKGGREALFFSLIWEVLPVAYGWYALKKIEEDSSFDILDLIQEGNVGVWRKLSHYDEIPLHYKDIRAYAKKGAKEGIKEAIAAAGIIRYFPEENETKQRKSVIKSWGKLKKRLNRDPTAAEIANDLVVEVIFLEEILDHMQIFLRPPTTSLDALAFKDGDKKTTLHEIIEDASALTPEELYQCKEEETKEQELLAKVEEGIHGILSATEQHVLSLRFGLYDDDAKSLKETSRVSGLSENDAHVIEEEALARLRAMPEIAERLQRVVQRPRVTVTPFYLPGIMSGSQAMAGRKVKDEIDFSHKQRWQEAQADAIALADELTFHPELAFFADQGLVPVRVWYQDTRDKK